MGKNFDCISLWYGYRGGTCGYLLFVEGAPTFFCFGAFGGFGLLSTFASAKADSRSAGVEVLYSGLRTYRSFIGT